MSAVTIEEAQANLPENIDKLAPGEELIITRNDQPIAKLVCQRPPARKPRQPGSAKGKLIILAEDDEHLEEGIHAVRLLLDTHAFLWFL
jgi:antitoxin (DNA-binding transcriptional repressor) of toxin-antitoxin stability system